MLAYPETSWSSHLITGLCVEVVDQNPHLLGDLQRFVLSTGSIHHQEVHLGLFLFGQKSKCLILTNSSGVILSYSVYTALIRCNTWTITSISVAVRLVSSLETCMKAILLRAGYHILFVTENGSRDSRETPKNNPSYWACTWGQRKLESSWEDANIQN